MSKQLLLFTRWVDQLNDRFGVIASWLVLIAVLISAGNAMIRYSFSLSSNAWLEVQWYLFAGMVMLGAATTFRLNEHVRVDVLFAMYPNKVRHLFPFLDQSHIDAKGKQSYRLRMLHSLMKLLDADICLLLKKVHHHDKPSILDGCQFFLA